MISDVLHNVYEFPDCKCLVACGDIHGDFNMLVNIICVKYQMTDMVVIVVGDRGFGYERGGGHARNARTYELAYENMERFAGTYKVMFSHMTSTFINNCQCT